MKKVIIIRYAELYLKGKNRGFFERAFATNIERALKGIRHELHRYSGRYLVEGFEEEETDFIVSRLKKVFGIHSMSVAFETAADMNDILKRQNSFPVRREVSKWNLTVRIKNSL